MAGPGARQKPHVQHKLRIDRWLWQARFFRSRATAAEQVAAGNLRVNGQRISKPGYVIGSGDVLTFAQGDRIRLIRVLELGQRRGPSQEALALYEDLDPLPAQQIDPQPDMQMAPDARPCGRGP
jgi:ribosome-associated heat shock protein Hsp15